MKNPERPITDDAPLNGAVCAAGRSPARFDDLTGKPPGGKR